MQAPDAYASIGVGSGKPKRMTSATPATPVSNPSDLRIVSRSPSQIAENSAPHSGADALRITA
jgi:hypothetical protein